MMEDQEDRSLLYKETSIDDLDKHNSRQTEPELDTLLSRADSVEKENRLLKYECSVLEKELEIQNEEREYSRRSAVALHEQYLESVKEIMRLEAECQRLHILVNKMLQDPGHDASFKDNPRRGREGAASRAGRTPSNPVSGCLLADDDASPVGTSEILGGKFDSMFQRLCDVEVENRTLKEILAMRENELNSWMVKCAQTVSRLAHAEVQLKELSEGQTSMQLAACSPPGCLPEGSQPDMEKMAIIAAETQRGTSAGRGFWLQEILELILEEHQVSSRSLGEILDDIKQGLTGGNSSGSCGIDATNRVKGEEESYPEISGFLTWESPRQGAEAAGLEVIRIESYMQEENEGLKDKLKSLESEIEDMELQLRSANNENEVLMSQLGESDENVENLRTELETLRESRGMIEDQIYNQRLINEDLEAQLTVAKVKLSEILQKLYSMEIELEDKNNCCEELEATCLELQLQLETLSRKGTQTSQAEQEADILKTELEVTAPSGKVVGNQEKIRSARNRSKAMSSEESALLDKAFSSTSTTTGATTLTSASYRSPSQQHSSLRDHLLAEASASKGVGVQGSPRTEEVTGIVNPQQQSQALILHDTCNAPPDPVVQVTSPSEVHYDVVKLSEDTASMSDLAVVPNKRYGRGFGFITKLFLRRTRISSNKGIVPSPRNANKLKQSR